MKFLSIWNRANPGVTVWGFREQSKCSKAFRSDKKVEKLAPSFILHDRMHKMLTFMLTAKMNDTLTQKKCIEPFFECSG